MSKMNLLHRAIKSGRLIQANNSNQGIRSLLRDYPRRFSTQAEQPRSQNSPIEPFLQPPTTGLVYGKLYGVTKHTTKSDVLNLFDGCNLSLDDVKVDYNRAFYIPNAMMVQFPSRSAYEDATRSINRKGRLYRLERADRSQWDLIAPFNGRTVLLQGIPRNALVDDVERFLSGCSYDRTSLQMLVRNAVPDPIRLALVNFPSPASAMHAFLTKNREFCLNNQILVRVLQ